MALKENMKVLIKSLSENNIQQAKNMALVCLEEDKTKKNESFCRTYSERLKNQASFVEMPYNIKNLVVCEDLTFFKTERYFLTEREKNMFDHILRIDKVGNKMNELGIHYINSTLFHGESGTGKTTFARYIAKKMNLPFLYLNFSNLIDSLMGGTSSNISKVFDYVNQNQCVLFLDEIDCISGKRSGNSGKGADGEINRITITLMQEFDKLNNNVILLAATNRIDVMDEALLRRFFKTHEVVNLKDNEIEPMINNYLENIDFELKIKIDTKENNQSKIVKHINELIGKQIENELME